MMKRHILRHKRKTLAAKTLARKIGYLRVQDFPASLFEALPPVAFLAHRVIRPKDQLFVVKAGLVEIWDAPQDMLVTTLSAGTIFGDMALLGQTMLGCQAIAGREGAMLGVMDVGQATEWVRTDPLALLHVLGPRFSRVEVDHYRVLFQTVDARLAAILLELAGDRSVIEGYTQEAMGERLGTYRETITHAMRALKAHRCIKVSNRKITILNRRALKELSEF
jgi:CRP-like cAMP-binding protein